MTSSDASPRPTKRVRTSTYRDNRTIREPSSGTTIRGRLSRASGAFSNITKTVPGPDPTDEEINESAHDSAYASREDSVIDQVDKSKEEGASHKEDGHEAMTTRRGGRRKVPTAKALMLQEQPVSARQSRRKTREAAQTPQKNDDDSNDKSHSPGPDASSMPSKRTSKRRLRSSTATEAPPTATEPDAVAIDQQRSKVKGKRTEPEATTMTASPRPKGILTPSSKRGQRSAKSVVFSHRRSSEKQIEQQLGFRDIDPTPPRKAKTGKISETSASAGSQESTRTDNADDVSAIDNADNIDNIFVDPNPPLDILSALSLPEPPSSTTIPLHAPDSASITAIKRHVLRRLTSSSLPPISPSLIPSHLASAYTTLSALLSSTITASESNSLLLLGSRGSGKSLLVNTALSSLARQHADDFHVVRLNGFLQTDDRLALREIWRQLGRDRAVDEDETGQVMSSYADTMASLLGLLSHPDEIGSGPDTKPIDANDTSALTTATASKSVIIVIDEFDLLTTHPRQTLLYNLFDIAQSRKAPIAVVGCSTRMDVVDCLEKRVKSRFSHRWVHVPTAKNLAAFSECAKTVLCVGDDEVISSVDEADRQQWNHGIENLLAQPHLQALLAWTFYSTKCLADVLTKLYAPIATLSLDSSPATSTSAAPNPNHPTPSPMSLLPNLPPLHLALLVAASRLDSIYLAPAVNFNAVFAHYSLLHRHTRLKLASASSSLRLWSRETCKAAWEDLVRWRFLVVVAGGGASAKDEKGESGLLSDEARWCRVEVTLDDVSAAVSQTRALNNSGANPTAVSLAIGGADEILARWCREETVAW